MLRHLFIVLAVISVIVAGVLTQAVRAASDWYVATNGNDANDCRSRATACRTIGAAIERAAAGDAVHVAAGVYTENLSLGKSLSLYGATSRTVIDGGEKGRVLHITGGSVSLHDLTIRNGGELVLSTDENGQGIYNAGILELYSTVVTENKGNLGGGIYNTGELSLWDSSVTRNYVTAGCAAIYNAGTLRMTSSRVTQNRSDQETAGICNENNASAVISRSTISDNHAAGRRSGISNRGMLEVINSTIAGNFGDAEGSGIGNTGTAIVINSTISGNFASNIGWGGGGIFSSGTLTLINSTITGNTTDGGEGGGGGLLVVGGITTIRNTIIAGNSNREVVEGPDCSGGLASVEGSLIQDMENCVIQGGSNNVSGVDPKLGPLRDNGGETQTHALLPGSPAIDAASSTACPATDQRGVQRPLDGNGDGTPVCDIGAFEYGTLPAPPTVTPVPPVETAVPPPPRYRVYLPLVMR